MQLNELVGESKKTWNIGGKVAYDPKDIELIYATMALGGEVGEFQNKVKKHIRRKYYTAAHSSENVLKESEEEIADVLYYIARISDLLGIDIEKAFKEKMTENAARYK